VQSNVNDERVPMQCTVHPQDIFEFEPDTVLSHYLPQQCADVYSQLKINEQMKMGAAIYNKYMEEQAQKKE